MPISVPRSWAASWAVVGLAACFGCSTSDPPPALTCVEGLTPMCSPLYDPPAFTTLFSKVLNTTCATGQNTCHTSSGSMGGLVFEDEDQSYALLLGEVDGRKRVIPGDPGCSLLMERLEANDASLRMPPGPTPLSAGERCDFVQWISNGAPR